MFESHTKIEDFEWCIYFAFLIDIRGMKINKDGLVMLADLMPD